MRLRVPDEKKVQKEVEREKRQTTQISASKAPRFIPFKRFGCSDKSMQVQARQIATKSDLP